MLGATVIAGFLIVNQIKMTSNAADSAKAVFAADAGIEWGVYNYSRPSSTDPTPVFSNGASFTVTCYDSSSSEIDCRNASTSLMKSSGRAGASYRAFELSF